ncbi:uncharacterized protein LOC142342974 [Convolutriloba macropyga]|uniref:uncharacterized protein LOC142342974 n=1 Tax=Convolutriloba macropyga TaxID=536237 RepID=UPI003F51D1D1
MSFAVNRSDSQPELETDCSPRSSNPINVDSESAVSAQESNNFGDEDENLTSARIQEQSDSEDDEIILPATIEQGTTVSFASVLTQPEKCSMESEFRQDQSVRNRYPIPPNGSQNVVSSMQAAPFDNFGKRIKAADDRENICIPDKASSHESFLQSLDDAGANPGSIRSAKQTTEEGFKTDQPICPPPEESKSSQTDSGKPTAAPRNLIKHKLTPIDQYHEQMIVNPLTNQGGEKSLKAADISQVKEYRTPESAAADTHDSLTYAASIAIGSLEAFGSGRNQEGGAPTAAPRKLPRKSLSSSHINEVNETLAVTTVAAPSDHDAYPDVNANNTQLMAEAGKEPHGFCSGSALSAEMDNEKTSTRLFDTAEQTNKSENVSQPIFPETFSDQTSVAASVVSEKNLHNETRVDNCRTDSNSSTETTVNAVQSDSKTTNCQMFEQECSLSPHYSYHQSEETADFSLSSHASEVYIKNQLNATSNKPIAAPRKITRNDSKQSRRNQQILHNSEVTDFFLNNSSDCEKVGKLSENQHLTENETGLEAKQSSFSVPEKLEPALGQDSLYAAQLTDSKCFTVTSSDQSNDKKFESTVGKNSENSTAKKRKSAMGRKTDAPLEDCELNLVRQSAPEGLVNAAAIKVDNDNLKRPQSEAFQPANSKISNHPTPVDLNSSSVQAYSQQHSEKIAKPSSDEAFEETSTGQSGSGSEISKTILEPPAAFLHKMAGENSETANLERSASGSPENVESSGNISADCMCTDVEDKLQFDQDSIETRTDSHTIDNGGAGENFFEAAEPEPLLPEFLKSNVGDDSHQEAQRYSSLLSKHTFEQSYTKCSSPTGTDETINKPNSGSNTQQATTNNESRQSVKDHELGHQRPGNQMCLGPSSPGCSTAGDLNLTAEPIFQNSGTVSPVCPVPVVSKKSRRNVNKQRHLTSRHLTNNEQYPNSHCDQTEIDISITQDSDGHSKTVHADKSKEKKAANSGEIFHPDHDNSDIRKNHLNVDPHQERELNIIGQVNVATECRLYAHNKLSKRRQQEMLDQKNTSLSNQPVPADLDNDSTQTFRHQNSGKAVTPSFDEPHERRSTHPDEPHERRRGVHILMSYMKRGVHILMNNMKGGVHILMNHVKRGVHILMNHIKGGAHILMNHMKGGVHILMNNMKGGVHILMNHMKGGVHILMNHMK